MIRNYLLSCFFVVLLVSICYGRTKKRHLDSSPTREFRAAWIATVANIDWPSRAGLPVEQQKKEFIDLLEVLGKKNINAVIFQVRPTSDAFYSSYLEPWSKYLTGVQGQSPSPLYDPLEFCIEECHKRGMEFHAWFNPYRIKQHLSEELTTDHVASINPDWTFDYAGKMYFDPANPNVRNWVTNVVRDVVRRYDVDAIHFDDYFYPYPVAGKPLPDAESFEKFNRGYPREEIQDWRRNNVDLVIKQLSEVIKEEKPWVKFGISPFGVYRNSPDESIGSNTQGGITNYDDLYADVTRWQQKGWIDYLMPQLYWQIGHPKVDYKTLADWWSKFTFDRALYIGLAPYKIDSKSKTKAWQTKTSITDQVKLNRSIPEIGGEGYFSAKHLKKDLEGLTEELEANFYRNLALVPTMPWIDNTPPKAPVNLKGKGSRSEYILSWDAVEGGEMDKARYYVLFEYGRRDEIFPTDSEHIVGITRSTSIDLRTLPSKLGKRRRMYRVASLDRLNNMSVLSDPIRVKI